MLTAIIAAAIAASFFGPFALDRLLSGTGGAYLRLAQRVREETRASGFVNGCGPVRRATILDIRAAEDRIEQTAWRARVVVRPRTCARQPDGRRTAAGRTAAAVQVLATVPRRPVRRTCPPAAPGPGQARPSTKPAPWPFRYPRSAPRPGLTPMEAILADLRG